MRKRKIIFFVIMLMLPIIFLEATLQAYYRIVNGRFLYERMAIPIYDVDEYRFYKLTRNLSYHHQTNEYSVVYHTNGQGFRTDHLKKDIPINKGDNTYRILFLGPSLTFGWANNHEDIYATIIGKNITIEGKTIEVMNIGTPGQPVNYQLCWLQKVGCKFKPDMVVQTVYGRPGVLEANCREPLSPPTVRAGYLYKSDPSLKMKFIDSAKNSGIVFYGWYVYQFMISKTENLAGLGTELYENRAEKTSGEDYESIVKRYLQYTSFVRETLGNDIPIVFIYVPYSYVVRPSDLSRWEVHGFYNPYELRSKAKKINSLLDEHSVPFVNPADELIHKDEETRMYYFLDIHLTPAGNMVVAEKTIPVIRELLNSSSVAKEKSLFCSEPITH